MTPLTAHEPEARVASEPKRPAYDPNNLAPEDAEARKYDDTSEGIDWDDIIATTQDDFLAGNFSYNSADYATQEEAEAGLRAWLHGIFERALSETGVKEPEPIRSRSG
jgi:hypothetical protein